MRSPASTRRGYLIWDDRVAAWRTAALNHVRLIEDVAARGLEVRDDAPDFFECPTLHPALPPLRPDQEAALTAWDRAGSAASS